MFLFETHISGPRAKARPKRTNFFGNFIVESRGQSSGIWGLWDEDVWNVGIIESSHQWVHLKVRWRNNDTWLVTAVYGSP